MKRVMGLLLAVGLVGCSGVTEPTPFPECIKHVVIYDIAQADGSVKVDTVGYFYVKTWKCVAPADSTLHQVAAK